MLFKVLICALVLTGFHEDRYRAAALKEKECTAEGNMCLSCDQSALCVFNPDTKKHEVSERESCGSGESCDVNSGKCSTVPKVPCTKSVINYEFHCYQIGIFPDAYDCKKYYICSEDSMSQLVKRQMNCPPEYFYDPLTTRCMISVNDGCPLPVCDKIGMSNVITANPSLYYVCMMLDHPIEPVLTPQIFVCPKDLVFLDGRCASVKRTIIPDLCSEEGIIFDPESCTDYYICNTVGDEPEKRKCDPGQRYDIDLEMCVDFECSK